MESTARVARGARAAALTAETVPAGAVRLRGLHDRLVEAYGEQSWWPAESSFEVVLGAYLTQNTAWTSVERSLENLRAAGVLSVEGLRSVGRTELEELIRPSGFHTRKAHAIQAFLAMLDGRFGGSLERMAKEPTAALRARLLALPGVGPETADAILLYAMGHAVPVADEYLRRIVERHGLLRSLPRNPARRYVALAEITQQAFAQDPASDRAALLGEFHALAVAVGKQHCRKVPRCSGCPLESDLHCSASETRVGIAPKR